MERQESNTELKEEPIILHLSGINKNWIRHKGEWVDMATLNQPKEIKKESIEIEMEVDESDSSSPRWMFWKK